VTEVRSAAAATSRDRRRSLVIFATCGLGAFLVSLDVSVANSLLPAIGRDLGQDNRAALSWVITAYAITFAAVLVPAGSLADRLGRRRVFLGGLVVFAVGSAGCAAAPSVAALVAGRVLQGVGAAAASPASLGLLLHSTPAGRRAVASARWAGMGAAGIGLGPLLGGVLTEWSSWRLAFLVNVPLVFAALVVGRRILPETDRHPGRVLADPWGAGLLAVSAGSATLALSEVGDWGLADWRIPTCGAAAILLGWIFVQRCRTVREPLLNFSVLGSRQVASVTAVTFLYSCGFFGLLFGFVLFLVQSWHLSLIEVGLALAPLAGVVMLLTTRLGTMADRYGYRAPLTVGCLLMTAGLGLSAAFDTGHHFEARWLVFVFVVGVGTGLCYPLLGAAAVAGLDARHLAAATGLNQCGRQIGAALGVAAAVAVLGPSPTASIGRFHAAWSVDAGFALAAALAASAIRTGRNDSPSV
jgi:NTE family protein